MTNHPMDTAALTMTQTTTFELLDPSGVTLPVEAELHYDVRDPYAAVVVFHTVRGPVRWTFGRELLVDGMLEPAGDGDVHVWPCLDEAGHAVIAIELISTQGCALLQARLGDVIRFVDRITAAVPQGTECEHLDVDAAIAALLDAA